MTYKTPASADHSLATRSFAGCATLDTSHSGKGVSHLLQMKPGVTGRPGMALDLVQRVCPVEKHPGSGYPSVLRHLQLAPGGRHVATIDRYRLAGSRHGCLW